MDELPEIDKAARHAGVSVGELAESLRLFIERVAAASKDEATSE